MENAEVHAFATRNLEGLGPPSDPIPFPRPQLLRGRRDTVCVYNPETGEHEVADNVLFRDFSRSGGSGRAVGEGGEPWSSSSCCRYAYWPNPYKEPIQT